MTEAPSPEHAEWKEMYGLLLDILERHGRHDPFGDGDFFLVDDDYGSKQHKIECTSKAVFTPVLAAEIQQLLESFKGWEVTVALPSIGGRAHGFAVTEGACIEHRG